MCTGISSIGLGAEQFGFNQTRQVCERRIIPTPRMRRHQKRIHLRRSCFAHPLEPMEGRVLLSSGLIWSPEPASPLVSAGTASITGFAYNDANANATKDTSETGISPLTIFLDANNNGRLDVGETASVTSATGAFAFKSLPAGAYAVCVKTPGGYRATTPHELTITVGSGQNSTGNVFLLTRQAKIVGTVFNDTGANGRQDVGETGLANVRVFLDLNKDGVWNANEPSTISDSSGAYTFSSVAPGTYRIAQVTPTGYRSTTPAAGFADITLSAAQVWTAPIIGDTAKARVAGTVFADGNGDGSRDGIEPGLGGILVYADVNKNGRYDIGEAFGLSGSNGAYALNVPAGTYTILQQCPSSYTMGAPGGYTVTLAAGQSITAQVFADRPIVSPLLSYTGQVRSVEAYANWGYNPTTNSSDPAPQDVVATAPDFTPFHGNVSASRVFRDPDFFWDASAYATQDSTLTADTITVAGNTNGQVGSNTQGTGRAYSNFETTFVVSKSLDYTLTGQLDGNIQWDIPVGAASFELDRNGTPYVATTTVPDYTVLYSSAALSFTGTLIPGTYVLKVSALADSDLMASAGADFSVTLHVTAPTTTPSVKPEAEAAPVAAKTTVKIAQAETDVRRG
jgi:hypothetical protein